MRIRSHLLRLVLAALVPVVVLASWLVWLQVSAERAAIDQNLLDVARGTSTAVDTEVQRSITALEILALSTRLDEGDLSRFRAQAAAARERHGNWSNVVLFDGNGAPLLSLRIPEGAPIPVATDLAPVRETLAGGGTRISNVLVSPTSGKPVVYVTAPVLRNGRPAGVLVATTEFDRWSEWLRARTPSKWITALDDRNGTIIARSESAEAFAGKSATDTAQAAYARTREGLMEVVNLQGERVYIAYHTSSLTGWHTLAIVPATVIGQPAKSLTVALLVASTLLVGCAVLLAYASARPITRGIAALQRSIERVGEGEAGEPVNSRIVEIDEAGRSAERAAQLLAARRAHVLGLQEELRERADSAEAANRAKDQFLGMLGHELRNPLGAIRNAGTVLHMQLDGEMRNLADIVLRQSRHLASLVDDLLDVSRAVSGKLALQAQRVDLANVVVRVKEALDHSGTLARHRVTVTARPCPVHGDPERLAQVVRNMIENAVRYTPAGGQVEVETSVSGMNAVLRVRDSGAGIDPALLPHIFEPFVQAPQSIERATGGLGLGLAIVKRVVELHHGSVSVHSEGLGRGAEFVVTLPRAGADADDEVPPPGPTHARRSLRVLLIEDHEDARAALRSLLLADGHRVTEAADGEAGLALLATLDPDIAFVDIGLPRLSGFELAHRARAQGLRTPLVALTGYGLPADRAAALRAGFDEVLVKPATYEQVDAALALAPQAAATTPVANPNA